MRHEARGARDRRPVPQILAKILAMVAAVAPDRSSVVVCAWSGALGLARLLKRLCLRDPFVMLSTFARIGQHHIRCINKLEGLGCFWMPTVPVRMKLLT